MSPLDAFRLLAIGAVLAPLSVSYAQVPPAATEGFGERDGAVDWVLGVAAEVDDESNDSMLTTFNLGVSEATWLSASAGRSRAPTAGADVEARTLELGVDHSFGLVGISFFAERWGDSDSLESRDRRASVYFQTDRFRVGLEREHRRIDIHFTVTDLLGDIDFRTTGLSANGTGVSLRARVGERWRLYGSRMAYRYTRNLGLLPRIARLNLLGTSTLTLANSFVDVTSRVGFEWTIRDRLFNVSMSSDRSGIDGSRFGTIDAAFLFPVGRRVDVEVDVGRSNSDLLQTGVYGSVLILVYGGG